MMKFMRNFFGSPAKKLRTQADVQVCHWKQREGGMTVHFLNVTIRTMSFFLVRHNVEYPIHMDIYLSYVLDLIAVVPYSRGASS